MTTTPLAEATYVLTIVADSGYESTMEGRCDAEQYALAVKALHEPAQARADLEAEVARLREALNDIAEYTGEGPLSTPWRDIVKACGEKARAALEGTK